MRVPDYVVKAEVARVRSEIEVFRDEYLPTLLRAQTGKCDCNRASHLMRDQTIEVAGLLSRWQEAAYQLDDMLRLGGRGPVDRQPFREFMVMGATTSSRCEVGHIRWRIELFASFNDALLWYPAPKEEQRRLSASADWPREHRIEIEAGLLSVFARGGQREPLVDVGTVANALCLVLPWIADVDPAFAKLVLDKETWRTLVATNHALAANERNERLRIIDGLVFGRILNNALLHVMGALANNHFFEIREHLHHPNLRGGYAFHFPYYLFTVLFEKAATLRLLAG
ncbi:MAG TPA: hypothetical protein VF278_12490 [Pirellulales bacterium]